MAQRYKKEGLVTIPSPVAGASDIIIDSPEFEIVQGRQVNSIAYIGIRYYYMQGSVSHEMMVEYSVPFSEFSQEEQDVMSNLIESAEDRALLMSQHIGATEV